MSPHHTWADTNATIWEKFKYWLKVFSTNMIISYIIKRLLLSLFKFALNIAIGTMSLWAIPFLAGGGNTPSVSKFFTSIGSLFGMGGGGMKMLTDGKYQKPKRTKRTKRRRKRKITKKPFT